MQITISDIAGFCFGVRRAVELVERTAAEGRQVLTLGPIVHNQHVVERFNALGVREAARVEEVPDGATVIIRAHGVGRAVSDGVKEALGFICLATILGALRELLTEGILQREAFNEVPPRVEHRLTEKGKSVLPLLQSICAWSMRHSALNEETLLSPCRQCPRR